MELMLEAQSPRSTNMASNPAAFELKTDGWSKNSGLLTLNLVSSVIMIVDCQNDDYGDDDL